MKVMTVWRTFRDRDDAGRQLAARLKPEDIGPRPLVWGVARGGVVVAAAVAERLGADLDVVVVRKIAAPDAPEYALGAVTADGPPLWTEVAARLAPEAARARWAQEAAATARQRDELYHRTFGRIDPAGRAVVVVDDGAATGVTVRAAARAARAQGAGRVLVALPVATPAVVASLQGYDADAVVVVVPDPDLRAVGQHYLDFGEVHDATVLALLGRFGERRPVKPGGSGR